MTEKSEDQVIWVWFNEDESNVFTVDPENPAVKPYIPHSKYLALKSDLAKAVEVMQEIYDDPHCNITIGALDRLKEALGKIGGGK